jgi:hypothetical protein
MAIISTATIQCSQIAVFVYFEFGVVMAGPF